MLITFITILLFIILHRLFVSNRGTIPNIIIQTWKTKESVPSKIYENIRKYAPGYKHLIFDDDECRNFIKGHFPKNVLSAYDHTNMTCHKADLFRYCYLYINGGIYLDIKTELIKNIDDVIREKTNILYTVQSLANNEIYQGVIATYPKNKIMFKLIERFLNTPKHLYKDKKSHLFLRQFQEELEKISNTSKLKIGYNHTYGDLNFILLKESCTQNKNNDCYDGLDRYGLCCFIIDENSTRVFKSRYSDFPWMDKKLYKS